MDFTIDTGDSADSQQLNETEWVRTLLEGGTLDPNSGIEPDRLHASALPAVGVPGAAEAARYTGVQDYDDYVEGTSPDFYDPDDAARRLAGWPAYPGLMDRAQQPFAAAGLDVPSYVVFGNHDGAGAGQPGRQRRLRAGRDRLPEADGPVAEPPNSPALLASLHTREPARLVPTRPDNVVLVPPDPNRRFVSKAQYKRSSWPARRPTATASATSTRPRRPPRTAPPATTPGARAGPALHRPRHRLRGRRSTGALAPTATSTTRSSAGSRRS